jgi:dimethylargininase
MLAVIRPVSAAMVRCELTHVARVPIDIELAARQHTAYAGQLEALGCRLIEVAPAADMPDSVFVEDTAVVVDEIGVITRPGAASRQREVDSMAEALAPHRELVRIGPPGTLDGGDVLRIGRNVYVGRSARTNAAGIEQLRAALAPFDYTVTAVALRGCLHLKSAVTQVAAQTLLINDACVERSHWPAMRCIAVDPCEPHAANAVWVGETVLHPASAVATRARLERAGLDVLPIDVSEFEKAEGGVTCCSILMRA